MTDSEEEILKNLLTWDNRDVVLRIRFNDSEEFEMTVADWAQDIGEDPHVHGTVVRTIKSHRTRKPEDAIMFGLREIESIADAQTREVIFQVATE